MGGEAGEGRGFSTGDSGGESHCRQVPTRALQAALFLCSLQNRRFMDWALSVPSCALPLALLGMDCARRMQRLQLLPCP